MLPTPMNLVQWNITVHVSQLCQCTQSITVRGKILKGEIFSELMALKSLARKNLANLLAVY